MPQHIASWNPSRQLWETETLSLFSELSEPYSETFPTSGMTRNGQLLPLPQSAPHTDGNESSSLLPTPVSATRERTPPEVAERMVTRPHGAANLDEVVIRDFHPALLPTPRATDGTNGGPNQKGSSGDLMLPSAVMEL